MNFKIMDIVKNDNIASFSYYRKGVMYYTVSFINSDTPNFVSTHLFPVPLEDIGDATLEANIKAITLMRYIRKAIADGTFVKNY